MSVVFHRSAGKMIFKGLVAAIVLSCAWIKSVAGGTSYSNVYMQSGPSLALYGPAALRGAQLAPLAAAPLMSSLLPPCVSPCVIPGQQVAALAPVATSSSNFVSYKSPISVPVVVAPADNEPTSYEYSYVVYDEDTGDQKAQKETSDGSVVRGQYSLIQPDGYVREVQYTADDIRGFNAVVKNFLPAVEAKEIPPCPEVKNEPLKESPESESHEKAHEAHDLEPEAHEEEHGHKEESHEGHDHGAHKGHEEHEEHAEPKHEEHGEHGHEEHGHKEHEIHEGHAEPEGHEKHGEHEGPGKSEEHEEHGGHEEHESHEEPDGHEEHGGHEEHESHEEHGGHEAPESHEKHAKPKEHAEHGESESHEEHANPDEHEHETPAEHAEHSEHEEHEEHVAPDEHMEPESHEESHETAEHGSGETKEEEPRAVQPGDVNAVVSYNDLIKCIQSTIKGGNVPQPSASPLTYIILNKPC